MGDKKVSFPVKFTFSEPVGDNSRVAIKRTITDLYKKVKKNKNFFEGLNINVCKTYDDLNIFTHLDELAVLNNDNTFQGVTIRDVFNEGIREFILKTGHTNDDDTNTEEEEDISIIEEATLHELGHNFDQFFAEKNLVFNIMYNELYEREEELDEEDEALLEETAEKINATFDLSDTDLFKNAWKKDVELLGKNIDSEDFENLGYFIPNAFSEIDITDGVSDEECTEADKDREEIFSQLTAYAFGSKTTTYHDKDLIIKSYSESFKVVKEYVRKFLGINCDTEQRTNAQ